jgi:Tfp pilus assembly protein PilF
MVYAKKGMLDEGMQALETALRIDPKYGIAHVNMAVVYHKKGDNKKAIEHCEKAIDLGTHVPPQLLSLLKSFR